MANKNGGKSFTVLHLINTLSAGGAELHLLTLCRHLKQMGVESIVAYLKEAQGSRALRPDFEREGIRVLYLRGEPVWNGRYLLRTAALIKQEKPDILHTHLPRADLTGVIVKLLRFRIPWVVSIHDIYSRSWRGQWTLPLFTYVWNRADALIAISHAVKDWLVRERHVPSEKVRVIHYGIEPEQFTHSNVDLRKIWGLDGKVVIGSIGRLECRKGHETLIRAMPMILQRVPNAILLIAGHDPWGYGKTLQTLIDDLELKDRVRLIGFCDDVPSFLRALDVFAFASISEGFGQVIIEAMAAGKPMVVSRIAPLTEIVLDGETGLLADPGDPRAFADAILWLLAHPEKAWHMGERGRQRVYQEFNAKKMAERIIALYQEVLAQKGA